MNQSEKRKYLINYLKNENSEYQNIIVPSDEESQKGLLRGLMNVRNANKMSDEFIHIQDEYLKNELVSKGIFDYKELEPIEEGIYLWQGDITSFKCDAIVNAANSGMLGCFCPNHGCIDNAIHTFAGIQLRLECAKIMEHQGYAEPTGKAKITKAYNLPCHYVIHTVGPIIKGHLTSNDRKLLASCYQSCLELAEKNKIHSIAFCCISTGEFHFPNDEAAKIAIQTVREYRQKSHSKLDVIFNVFKDMDYNIYKRLLMVD
jgi:O-acetyl-ADP-ribose deacetylase (regulator of RNase III)